MTKHRTFIESGEWLLAFRKNREDGGEILYGPRDISNCARELASRALETGLDDYAWFARFDGDNTPEDVTGDFAAHWISEAYNGDPFQNIPEFVEPDDLPVPGDPYKDERLDAFTQGCRRLAR
jgi:hypothetical protein